MIQVETSINTIIEPILMGIQKGFLNVSYYPDPGADCFLSNPSPSMESPLLTANYVIEPCSHGSLGMIP